MALYNDRFVKDATRITALLFKDQLVMFSEDTFHTCRLSS